MPRSLTIQLQDKDSDESSGLMAVMALAGRCGALPESSCVKDGDGKCEWKDKENKCDINGIVAMQLLQKQVLLARETKLSLNI